MVNETQKILLDGPPVTSLDEYQARGGLQAYEKIKDMDPRDVLNILRQSGLRGRGGAGFPTHVKWQGILESPASRKFICANGAEGEPGTFKDRWLIRHNPYQALEGLAIGSRVIGADTAFFCIKAKFEPEKAALQRALGELQRETTLADNIELVLGPDEYLYGEEKGLLEVIEGGPPAPRVYPPYIHGLFGGAYGGPRDGDNNPTNVNNVETLSHVTHIIRNGPDWFRSFGTPDTPGTMIFAISGDVQTPIIRELPLGLTLRDIIDNVAGGMGPGRGVKAVFPGVANAVITERMIDIPLGFDSMRKAGSALGSAGFIVYDDTACMAQVAYIFSRFLYVESCGQCPSCKLGSKVITERLERVINDIGSEADVTIAADATNWVENGHRCYLPTSESIVTRSLLNAFPEDFAAHVNGSCGLRHDMVLPKMTNYVEGQGFIYDLSYVRKQPDWSFAIP